MPEHELLSDRTFMLVAEVEGEGEAEAAGTATILRTPFALTAKHVFTELQRRFGEYPAPDGAAVPFTLRAFQHRQDGSGSVYAVKTVTADEGDLAVLTMSRVIAGSNPPWPTQRYSMDIPEVGSDVLGFGFSDAHHSLDVEANTETLKVDHSLSSGQVLHVFPEGVAHMTYPCFVVNARFEDNMSGGPVFNSSGEVCGIISSSFNENTSIVASIWPMMGLRVERVFDDVNKTSWLFHDIAAMGGLLVAGWDRVGLVLEGNGQVREVSLAPVSIVSGVKRHRSAS